MNKRSAPTYPLLIRAFSDHSALARDLRKYVKAHYSSRGRAKNAGVQVYWRVLPTFLAKKSLQGRLSTRALNRFLQNIILAQRMLYLAIRIQDDLLDGQASTRSLIFASDQLFFEAEALFSKYFPKDSRFWTVYRDCLRETTQSIVELDRLEKSLRTKPNDLLDFHAKVCSIFKIGSAAVCARSKEWRHFPRISAFCDEMAKAGQIIDDLMDLQEDLERKRYNYAAIILYHNASTTGKAGNAQKAMPSYGDRLGTIFRAVQSHVARAHDAIRPVKIPEAGEFVSHYQVLVSKIEKEFARSRTEAFFAPLIKEPIDGGRA